MRAGGVLAARLNGRGNAPASASHRQPDELAHVVAAGDALDAIQQLAGLGRALAAIGHAGIEPLPVFVDAKGLAGEARCDIKGVLQHAPVAHAHGERDLSAASRLRVEVDLRGRHYAWIAPFEDGVSIGVEGLRGRLTGFAVDESGTPATRPSRDFRGWLWHGGPCLDAGADTAPRIDSHTPTRTADDCRRRTFFSVRLPVEVLQDDLLRKARPVWPPADLNRIDVRVR